VRIILQASKSDGALWSPQSESERAHVREQLERLLAHRLFHFSKRYPALLRYAVEQTLLGNGDHLKERTIGVELFGCEPDYDTNANPVVRFTASEIRKRLAQYYVDAAHFDEIQIDLPTGSYVAVFSRSAGEAAGLELSDTLSFNAAAAPVPAGNELPAPRPLPAPAPHRSWRIVALVVLCAALAGIAGLCAGIWLRTPLNFTWRADPHANPMDQFWSFITNAPGTVTFCIGEPNSQARTSAGPAVISGSAKQPLFYAPRQPGDLAIDDVLPLTHLASALDARGKPFRISTASQTTFGQLRDGPIILIGALDNSWTQRLTENLRFNFLSQDGFDTIVDHRGSGRPQWSVPWNLSDQKLTRDYAIVARFRDSTTGQPVILVAGIAAEGTEAAGEFLSNPDYFAQLLQRAPHNWPTMNMEVVIQTQVIDGHPGPPSILAVEFW
jgi:hypothetical protein